MKDLDPLDPAYVADVLSRPPFVNISGVTNVRDLGSYPSVTHPGKMVKPRMLFRSAEVSSITEEGKAQLKALRITTIFDIRSDTEIQKYKSPVPSIDGVEIIHRPVFRTEDYSPEMMAKRFQLYSSGKTEAFMELYSQILDHGGSSFGAILRHVRDNPTTGCLIHCTAGKDRTGIISAILLKLVGVDNESIGNDYALTRIGREPIRELIMNRLALEPIFVSNNEAALNMFSCRHETMMAFLSLLQEKYDGVEAYCKNYLGLQDEDIHKIQSNILVSSNPCR